MTTDTDSLRASLAEKLGAAATAVSVDRIGQLQVDLAAPRMIAGFEVLRDDPDLRYGQLIDLCGIDYADYQDGTSGHTQFAVVYQLLSLRHNRRLRVRVFAVGDEFPTVATVAGLWPVADWFEREAFDLFGIVFEGHPDLRRILTDYGFIGHPMRKDFPLNGTVEVIYDETQKRVRYQPVSIENRITVPRTVRHDHRYEHPVGHAEGEE